jgi:hypothetical protein
MMIEIRLHQIESRVEHIFELARLEPDDEIKSHLARYLCILTSGFMEESLKIIIEEFVKVQSSSSVTNFVAESIKHITNLNCEKLVGFISKFDSDYGKDLMKNITDEEKTAIDSVLANRNQIAHGQNVGIGYVSIHRYYQDIKSVIEKVRILLAI